MERLQITTLAAQNITIPLLAATYTALSDREVLIQVYLSGVAGAGSYRACVTKQLGGVGTVHQGPTAALPVSAGVTTGFIPGLPLPVKSADVVRVYVQGLAGDVAVGVVTEVFDVTASAADVWAYASRTLTQSAASVAAAVAGSTITIQRGDTLSAALTNIGALTGYVSLDFTVKRDKEDADSAAIIRIRKNASGLTDGLRWLNGADASTRSANGSITIDDEPTGDITIALASAETDDLTTDGAGWYDIQMITAAAVTTLSEGICSISADVTRLIA